MNETSSLRCWLVLATLGAFTSSTGLASELPPIIPAEEIVQQLSPSAPLPAGRKRKIEFEPAGEESVSTQPAPISGHGLSTHCASGHRVRVRFRSADPSRTTTGLRACQSAHT